MSFDLRPLTKNRISAAGGALAPEVRSVREEWINAYRSGTYWNALERIDCFVDKANGNDSNPGTYSSPKATIAGALTVQTPGFVVGLKRADPANAATVFRETVSVSQDDIAIVAYGPGQRAFIDLTTQVSGTWTNTTGNIWSISLVTAPDTVLLISSYSDSGITKLWKYASTQTAPAAGQFGYTASTLYVYSTVDPGTLLRVGYTVSGATIGVSLNNNRNLLQDVAVIGSSSDGIYLGQDVAGSVVRGCDLSFNTSDGGGTGGHGTAAAPFIVEYCRLASNGFRARDGTNADGDGFSPHGDAAARSFNGIVRYCTFLTNRKSGLGPQGNGNLTYYGNYFDNNYKNFTIFNTTYNGSEPYFTFTGYNNVTIRRANDVHNFSLDGTPNYATRWNLYNNTIFSMATTASQAGVRGSESANLTLTMRNNIISGHDRGLDIRGTATVDLDYNNVSGNTNNYFDNSTGFLTGKTGANSVSGSPNFVSTTDPNLALRSTSPSRGTGQAIGLTETFRRATPSSPPNIGAI